MKNSDLKNKISVLKTEPDGSEMAVSGELSRLVERLPVNTDGVSGAKTGAKGRRRGVRLTAICAAAASCFIALFLILPYLFDAAAPKAMNDAANEAAEPSPSLGMTIEWAMRGMLEKPATESSDSAWSGAESGIFFTLDGGITFTITINDGDFHYLSGGEWTVVITEFTLTGMSANGNTHAAILFKDGYVYSFYGSDGVFDRLEPEYNFANQYEKITYQDNGDSIAVCYDGASKTYVVQNPKQLEPSPVKHGYTVGRGCIEPEGTGCNNSFFKRIFGIKD